MFSRALALTSMVSLSVLAAAMPGGGSPTSTITIAPGPTSTPASQCSTGKLQCCNQVQKADDPAMTNLLSLIGVVVQGVDVLAGIDCTPISVINVAGSNQCNAEAVCCTDNNVGGLISLGCVPVTL